ncbi:signal peptidase [Neisseria dumasiana]|uniref:Signal peptidase n=1 Tax=Neisseria dumasiana TaxID=1931275 RepID=A0ABX3WND5_9NEIS|nr:signal peptidase [Neisseria dumasiana]OSI35529.1 signal peptidase [Neisseria dumasiana]UOO85664.1 signal peptidase [Neisseria dumasiana]
MFRLLYSGRIESLRPLQNPHLRRISALCAARSLAYLHDMSALAALLRLELHPHLEVLQRSQSDFTWCRLFI